MIFLMMYDEFGKNMGLPSIKDSFSTEPFPGKNAIVSYLQRGRKTYASTGIPVDVISGEAISGEECGMTDGEYSWLSTLPYYVEKYNLRLPKEFEEKVLGIGTRLIENHE